MVLTLKQIERKKRFAILNMSDPNVINFFTYFRMLYQTQHYLIFSRLLNLYILIKQLLLIITQYIQLSYLYKNRIART